MMGVVDLSQGTPAALFLSGVYMATFGASGLFFYRYWMKTRERFFLLFGTACWMLSLERIALLRTDPAAEPYTWCHLFRLTAFVLILLAVYRANRARAG